MIAKNKKVNYFTKEQVEQLKQVRLSIIDKLEKLYLMKDLNYTEKPSVGSISSEEMELYNKNLSTEIEQLNSLIYSIQIELNGLNPLRFNKGFEYSEILSKRTQERLEIELSNKIPKHRVKAKPINKLKNK